MKKLCSITYENAFQFRMPFGRYKGQRLGDLPKKYVEWISNNLKGSIQARANILLICGDARG